MIHYSKILDSKILVAALLTVSASTVLFGQEGQKKPAIISYATGAVNNTYSLVQTTIYKDPKNPDPAKPIITRAQLDVLDPNKQSSKPLELKLETPVPPVTINTYGATEVVSKIGDLVGSLGNIPAQKLGIQAPVGAVADPKAAIVGKAIQTGAELANVAIKIAEGELTKLYENQEIRVNLLEIIPKKYYTIDITTGKINPTDDFWRDFLAYTKLLQDYLQAFKEYRKYENVFTQMSLKARAVDPAGKNKPLWETVRGYDAKEVQPRLKEKNQLEDQLARMFPLYRIAVMASPSEPGNTCGAAGQGPWELYIIYYLGAEQTNQIAVKYCVKNAQDFQRLMVEVVKNSVLQTDPQYNRQQFRPGGVRLQAQSNATFAQATGIGQGNFNATQTEVFNWFTEMVKSPAGDSIESYLIPFDVNAVRQSIAQRAAAAPQDVATQTLLRDIDSLTAAIPKLTQRPTTADKTKEQRDIDAAEEIGKLGLGVLGEAFKAGIDISRAVTELKKPETTEAGTQTTETTTQSIETQT